MAVKTQGVSPSNLLTQHVTENDIMDYNAMTRSVLVRRNAALTMICACVESGKPHAFIPWLFSTMIDEVLPVEKCEPHKLVGFLLVARHSFSHLNKCHDKINNPEALATHLCQVK